nr:ERF family protein [Pseudomonas sp.]
MKELLAAFVKAQGSIEKATKDKANPHFRSKYADLGSVVDAIKPALEENGLGFIQKFHDDDKAIKVETIIVHSSGEQLSCGTLSIPVSKHDAQGFGSACTYARRYSLQAAFGVAPEDDDGNAATKAAPKRQEASQEPTKAPITDDRFGKALNAIGAGEYTAQALRQKFILSPEQEQELSKLEKEAA